ncbi:MAG: transposase [Acidobacteria bacterium]|nr:transposase [Acidobacteriota bacterium]
MAVKRRVFSRDFKLQVVREVETGKSQAQIAREHRISQNLISRWCRQHRRYKDRAFVGKGHAYTDDSRFAALERMVGKLTMENDLLKKVLQKLEEET